MKLLVAALFAVLAVSVSADYWDEVDHTKVIPITDMPGFWDGRILRPSEYVARGGRIVGGEVVVPHTHPYQTALLMQFTGGTGLCGGSVISTNRVLTAAHCPIGSISTQVIAGAHDRTVVEPSQQRVTVPASGFRIHVAYNPSNLNNDSKKQ